MRAELEREAEARDVVLALRAVAERELVLLRALVLFRAVVLFLAVVLAFFAAPRPGSFCCKSSRSFRTDLLVPRRLFRASLSCLSSSFSALDPPELI